MPAAWPRPCAVGALRPGMHLNTNTLRHALLIGVFLGSITAVELGAQASSGLHRKDVVRGGDILRLRIWREPDMSGDYQVNADGQAILPRLGQLDVAAIPADSLQSVLTERYRVYLNNPSIEILLLRRISITGAVRNPGVYPVDPTLSVSDAVALAGGPAPDGKRDRVEVRRGGQRILADLHTDVLLADSPVQSGDQIYVPARAWLVRNPWVISAGVTLIAVWLQRTTR